MKELQNILDIIERKQKFDVSVFGVLRQTVSDSVRIFDSKDPSFNTIILYGTITNPIKVSFGGENYKIYLKDIQEIYKSSKFSYNFRDDVTVFVFDIGEKNKKIKNVILICEKKLEYDANNGVYTETDTEGNRRMINQNELCFNNFSLEFVV